MIIGNINIAQSYADCEECNAQCYKLIDCLGTGNHPTQSTTQNFAAYVGNVIKWTDDSENPAVERCAIVEAYTCRLESYAEITATIVDCFPNCSDCAYVEPDPEETPLTIGRSVTPGYDVPECGGDFTQAKTTCDE